MNYVDGFVIAVATVDRDKYQQYAQAVSAVFKDNGALSVVECWGDDVPEGKLTSFPMAVKCQPDETVVFSWVTWPSKTIRDQGIAKAMDDPRFDMSKNPLPFDGKRMIYGGFEMIVDA